MTERTPDISAVIYCRVSSAKQVTKGDGLGSQETRCREFARRRGYKMVQVFKDDLTGGLVNRPGMQSMLAFLRKHRRKTQHVVIIDDISRLARGLEAHIKLRTDIGDAGGKLESPSIEFGEDSDSLLVENLLASVSQHQRQKNAEQVVNRMRARVLNGYWCFSPPLGYRYERVDGHGKLLVPDQPVADIVTEALEGFASGRFETVSEVQAFLEGQPNFPRARNGAVHFQVVQDLLERVLYTGLMDVPKWKLSLHSGKHQPLITFEVWQKNQKRLKSNAKAPARKDLNADFPLRGFVTCGSCGKPMTACWSKGRNARHPYYLCHSKGCQDYRKSIRRSAIEEEFRELLGSMRPTPELFFMAKAMLEELWDNHTRQAGSQCEAYKLERQAAIGNTEKLMARILECESDALVRAYEDQIRKFEERRISLAEKIANCGRPLESFDENFRTAMQFLANPQKLWDSGAIEDQRMVIRLTFAAQLAYDRNLGFRTAETTLPFMALAAISGGEKDLVEPNGIEPSTS